MTALTATRTPLRSIWEWYERLDRARPAVVWVDSPRQGFEVLPDAAAETLTADRVTRFRDSEHGHCFVCKCRSCAEVCWCPLCLGENVEWGFAGPGLVIQEAQRLAAGSGRVHVEGRNWRRTDDRTTFRLSQFAGWWVLGPALAVVSAPAVDLQLDEAGRLHATDGPAARFRDGWELQARRGVLVPPGHADRTLTARDIQAVPNLEVRRELIDEFGRERFIDAGGGRLMSRDEAGELWQLDMAIVGGSGLMVKVLDATPDAAGVRRQYWLRVPPNVRTAQEGVAWTFGLAPRDYQPVVET